MKRNSRVPTMVTADSIHDYLAAIGRRGGSVLSWAKTQAAIANGRMGGRPRHTVCCNCQYSRWTVRSGRKCSVKLVPRTCPYCRPHEPSEAGESKAKRIGRCKPNASGVRPSKRKK